MSYRSPRKQARPPQPRTLPSLVHAQNLDSNVIKKHLENQAIVRLRHGIYTAQSADHQKPEPFADELKLLLQRIAATQKFVPSSGAFSHTSAAALWGLPIIRHELVPRISGVFSGHAKVELVKKHHAVLPAADVRVLSGVPLTSLERTTVDCLRLLRPADGLIIADAALRIGLDRERALQINKDLTNPRYRRRTAELLRFADIGAESPGESVMRWHLGVVGWPGIETQVPVETAGGVRFLDAGDVVHRVGWEYDGRGKYVEDALFAEKAREHNLRLAGWHIERFIADDFKDINRLHSRLTDIAAMFKVQLSESLLAQYAFEGRRRKPRW